MTRVIVLVSLVAFACKGKDDKKPKSEPAGKQTTAPAKETTEPAKPPVDAAPKADDPADMFAPSPEEQARRKGKRAESTSALRQHLPASGRLRLAPAAGI